MTAETADGRAANTPAFRLLPTEVTLEIEALYEDTSPDLVGAQALHTAVVESVPVAVTVEWLAGLLSVAFTKRAEERADLMALAAQLLTQNDSVATANMMESVRTVDAAYLSRVSGNALEVAVMEAPQEKLAGLIGTVPSWHTMTTAQLAEALQATCWSSVSAGVEVSNLLGSCRERRWKRAVYERAFATRNTCITQHKPEATTEPDRVETKPPRPTLRGELRRVFPFLRSKKGG